MNDVPPMVISNEDSLNGTLGIEFVEVTDDVIRGRMPVEDRIRQPYGIVHGGAMSTIAESLTSLGTARGVFPDGKIAMGQEINASFMRPRITSSVTSTNSMPSVPFRESSFEITMGGTSFTAWPPRGAGTACRGS